MTPRHARPRRYHLGVTVLLPLLLTSAMSITYGDTSTSLKVTTAVVSRVAAGSGPVGGARPSPGRSAVMSQGELVLPGQHRLALDHPTPAR